MSKTEFNEEQLEELRRIEEAEKKKKKNEEEEEEEEKSDGEDSEEDDDKDKSDSDDSDKDEESDDDSDDEDEDDADKKKTKKAKESVVPSKTFDQLVKEELEAVRSLKEDDQYEGNKKYDEVFKAVADYCDVDPEDVDNADEEKKDKFYNTLDQCWDAEENKVPDSCPVDIGNDE